jgi:hypothetical protein
MRCRTARILTTREWGAAIAPAQRHALYEHLDRCAACRQEKTALAELDPLLRHAGGSHEDEQPASIRLDARTIVSRARERRLSSLLPRLALSTALLGAAACATAALWLRSHRATSPANVAILPHGTPQRATPAVKSAPPGVRVRRPANGRTTGRMGEQASPARPNLLPPPYARPGAPRPVAPMIDDDRWLDGSDAQLVARWMTGNPRDARARAWLRRLPRYRDDFVQVAFPRLASAAAGGAALRDAIHRYEQEARVIDPRLFARVSFQLKAAPLTDFCALLAKQTGVELTAGRGVADENVTLFLKDQPARDVMREVARLFGYQWRRSGEAPTYHYELIQELKEQVAEEEMRNRDRHQALLALDEEMAKYQPYLNLTRDELKARQERAAGAEKRPLDVLAGKGWGPVQMYNRLTPAQRLALASGETLSFSTHAGPADLRIPADLRKPILESTGLTLGTFEGAPAVTEKGFGEQGTPLANLPDASATVTLTLNRSELGQLTLRGHTSARLENQPDLKVMFWAGGPILAQAASPSVAKPDNASANARLRSLPEFKQVISLRPLPSCPWFAPGGKPEDRQGFEMENAGRTLHFGPGGHFETADQPHVATADVWEALYRATGRPVIADAYSRAYPAGPVTLEKASLFDALCRAGDELGARWQKDGDFLLVRSTSFFWDKLKEVPARQLRRWQADRRRRGFLPLDDLLEMATCTDGQLDSATVGYVIGHCWGLEEWGIVGTGGAFRLGLPGGAYVRRYARFLEGLGPVLRERAQGTNGVALAELLRPQQEALTGLVMGDHSDPQALAGLRFRFDYAPVGTYVWHPVVATSREAEEMGAKWPVVAGRTAGETLALARRVNPAAAPDEIKRSRGLLGLQFQNGRGDMWQRGGPSVAFRLNQ